jgi:hypothetical protein
LNRRGMDVLKGLERGLDLRNDGEIRKHDRHKGLDTLRGNGRGGIADEVTTLL